MDDGRVMSALLSVCRDRSSTRWLACTLHHADIDML